MSTVQTLLEALNDITKGRCLMDHEPESIENNPYAVIKNSDIPGKSVIELPGLVIGDLDQEIHKVGIVMTLTESVIELASATGIDALISHHPIADGANSGGVTLKDYTKLYGISFFELHEAFHGLHPGIPFLHGHKVIYTNTCYGDITGNIVYVGKVYPQIHTLGDILARLHSFINLTNDKKHLYDLQNMKGSNYIESSNGSISPNILLGDYNSKVNQVIHIFPHTGFTPEQLESLYEKFPDSDTVIASLSRLYLNHPLIETAANLGLNLLNGNTHSVEIYENGIPLAYAIRKRLPDLELILMQDDVYSYPLNCFGNDRIRQYGEFTSSNYL